MRMGAMKETETAEILLVEDNPNDAELTLNALREHHISKAICVVSDGTEALDFVFGTGKYSGRGADRLPRLVILDLKLPKVDGLEVLRRLKSNERTRSIPVVVLTSSREETDVVRSYALGVNSYVVKPVEFEAFSRVVGQIGSYWLSLNQPPC
jgi:two-component system, response regulator